MKMNIIFNMPTTEYPYHILCYIDTEVFNIRDFKIIFILGYLLTPRKGAPRGEGAWGGLEGGFYTTNEYEDHFWIHYYWKPEAI